MTTAALARVAWPHRGTSTVGVNHRMPNSSSAGTMNAVSARLFSAATACISSEDGKAASTTTAAGFPEKFRVVKASTLIEAGAHRGPPVGFDDLLRGSRNAHEHCSRGATTAHGSKGDDMRQARFRELVSCRTDARRGHSRSRHSARATGQRCGGNAAVRHLGDLRPEDLAEADGEWDDQPEDSREADVGPLLTRHGTVEHEQRGLSEVDVDPGTRVVEPGLAVGEKYEQRRSANV
jgi:hypothetical protein